MSSSSPHLDQVFIVRMWTEQSGGEASFTPWRGRVDHLNTAHRCHFVGLDSLLETIRELASSALSDASPEVG